MPAETAATTAVIPPIEKKPDELLNNFKAEMDRKMKNLETTNSAILAQLTKIASPPAPAKKKQETTSLKDVWYDDPDKAASILAQQITDQVMGSVGKVTANQNKQNSVMAALYKDYPELSDSDNSLTKKAVEIFDALSDEEKQSPMAYRLAVKEAAQELSVKPKSKRSDDDKDHFSLGGGAGKPSKKAKDGELDERTLQFAELVGLDVSKPETLENLKKRSQRRNWQKWE